MPLWWAGTTQHRAPPPPLSPCFVRLPHEVPLIDRSDSAFYRFECTIDVTVSLRAPGNSFGSRQKLASADCDGVPLEFVDLCSLAGLSRSRPESSPGKPSVSIIVRQFPG